jgi:hypothetical protein
MMKWKKRQIRLWHCMLRLSGDLRCCSKVVADAIAASEEFLTSIGTRLLTQS